MSLQGDLEFRDANKITFIGGSSNTLIDLTTGSLGVGVTGTSLSSNLHVAGNKIKVGDNIFSTDGPHARLPKEVPLKKYPEIIFESGKFDSNDSTNTYVQAGYTVTASTGYIINADIKPWKVHTGIKGGLDFYSSESSTNQGGVAGFIGTSNTYVGNSTLGGISGEWVKTEFPTSVKISQVDVTVRDSAYSSFDAQSPSTYYIIGSHDGTTWSSALGTVTDRQYTASDLTERVTLTNTEYYRYYAIVVTKVSGNHDVVSIDEIEYYGYEEDPPLGDTSMDTTFASIMNTPQTTGANVYVDAKLSSDFTNQVTGPTPVGTAAVHDNTNKYWELTGTLTSNITVEANTFLEGDQPHAVSVWFNSSNLEANVSNTCVFSVSDQEKLNSQNLDLQSNTWHNLTYAYQGEGGSRVAYLDGRKVAEDQAEDTFGEYPPFDMTEYEQNGYAVSRSNDYDSDPANIRQAWKAFSSSGAWMTEFDVYGRNAENNNNGALNDAPTITDTSGTSHTGHQVTLETPFRLRVSYLAVNASVDGRRPENVVILGSNDNENWDLLYTNTSVPDQSDNNLIINSVKDYKYHMFMVKNLDPNGEGALYIPRLQYYGHRENDLVRLPDPTNVLKYPHIPFALGRGGYLDASGSTPKGEQSYSLRGYTVTSSSNYGNGGTDTRSGWCAFDEGNGGTTHNIWQSGDYYVNNTTPGTYNRSPPERHTAGGVNYDGEWIKLELPHKINVTGIEINSATYATSSSPMTSHIMSRPYEGAILGSNDGSKSGTWDLLKAFSGGLTWTTTTIAEGGGRVTLIPDTNTGNAYKYLVLIVNKNEGPRGQFDINEIKYYGTGVDSVPIQIGGGNIDKVANFRVYDKFVGEDQALEIWDAQKDEFRGVKNSVTLQKGRLGLGTTEPEGRLAVLDEPDPTYGLQKFPPRAISVLDYDTHIMGHGKFEFYSSQGTWAYSYRGNTSWDFTRAFTPRFTTDGGWHGDSLSTPGTYQIVGVYAPAITSGNGLIQSTLKDGSVVYGDWIAMRTPYAINVTRIATAPRKGYGKARGIGKFIILGSNNGVDWEHTGSGAIAPHDMSSATDAGGYGIFQSETIAYVSTNSNGYYYTYHRLVATHIMGHRGVSGHPQYQVGASESLNQSYLRFFGTREQLPPKQSVLHDGQLTLTKNLTVPSIGPSVTDTRHVVPKRHRLVVEFDTSTNPTGLTTVRDTSEMGNDGTLIGNAYYSIGDKAFKFDGSGDYISTPDIGFSGDQAVSVSIWFKYNGVPTSRQDIFGIGKGGTGTQFGIATYTPGTYLYTGANDLYNTGYNLITDTSWHHIVAIYRGGTPSTTTMSLYLDNVNVIGNLNGTNATQAANFDVNNCPFNVGAAAPGTNPINGSISNPKLYNTALTAGDVKKLYDMGRGDSYHVTNFQNTLVGINLGNGQAPRSALDVRDKIYAESSSVQTFTGQHICFPDESMEKGLIVSAKKNKFVKLNGLATGKSAITIDESLPIVSLSNVAQDKACFGVVSKMEESNAAYRTEITGGLVSESVKIVGDNRAIVNSVGEGAIWVVDTNGSLESGDYITTSNVAGYGQKQDSEFLANYSVAKITMDCDFTGSNVAVQTIKREETGTRIITEDAWNQLVEYDRYSNVEDEITTYYQIQRGENVLDDNGQLQFEDKTGATEEPYERRFLTTDGTQTDEANAVHIAAFVGCTYHCG